MATSLDFRIQQRLISGGRRHGDDGFFRCRIDAMIDLRHPLAVPATRLPWQEIEVHLAPKFQRLDRAGELIEGQDMLGPTTLWVGAGRSNAGRPRLPIRAAYTQTCLGS